MAAMAAPARPLQLTLALLKPDAVAHPLVREVRAGPGTARHSTPRHDPPAPPLPAGRACRHPPSPVPHRARQGAAVRRGAEPPLLPGARSGPMWAYILAHENAVPLWRSVMGPTKVFRARHSHPDSIRGAYGLTDTRNTTHGSDSPASASREIAFFFPEFDERRWYEQDEPQLRRGQLFYSAEEGVHRVLRAQQAQVQTPGSAGCHCCPCPQQCPEWICSGSCVSSHKSENCCPQCC
ncbi:nucleoside diphosphate kinase 6 isoform X2 [Taeniopygia guttata]|uniref:nucleoside diphosphate kinase 6 isoform X2 n=1 Tax=Taeniopygia guttata TaxID=59729 RepID=UPI003BB8D62B